MITSHDRVSGLHHHFIALSVSGSQLAGARYDPSLRMRRNLIAVALLCCETTASHAQSSVTLYGLVDAGVSYISNERAGKPGAYVGHSNVSMQSGNLSGSRWGIKGAEALGGGFKAIFVLEEGFNDVNGATSKSNTLFSRLAFVGVSSNRFGSLTMGRQYSSMTDFIHPVSPSQFVGGIGASPGNIDDLDTTARVDNSIKYVSDSYGGFQFGALYGFGDQAGSLKRKSTWSIGAGYANGPLKIGAGYERSDNSKTGPSDPTSNTWDSSDDGTVGSSISEGFATAQTQQVFAAGATYNFGHTLIGVDYSNVRFEPGVDSLFSHEAIYNTIGVFGNWTHDARFHIFAGYTYTRSGEIDDTGDRAQYHDVTLGLSYDLSRRTTVYALTGYQKAIGKTLNSLGDVADATASVGDKGIGHSAATGSQGNVRIGIRHRF